MMTIGKTHSFLKVVLVAAGLVSATITSAEPTVEAVVTRTVNGQVQGVKKGQIASYKGIPFAAPPVGPLRWKNPQPPAPWEGIRKADAYGPSPLQNVWIAKAMGTPDNYSEDCLYLNVWTPAEGADHKLPVMVWIYGGGFTLGSTALPLYDGSHLASKGVIVVSIAYRVGVFGFLAHPELTREGGKGNFGIQDQLAGLKWVRDNIASFGGDPGNVTIFGESAGGMSVSLLAGCPPAKGLFHRAISQSGALMAPARLTSKGIQGAKMLATTEQEGVRFLAALGAEDIEAARALPASKVRKPGFEAWPCYDEDFLPADLPRLYLEGKANETPLLIGYNSDDGNVAGPGIGSSTAFRGKITEGFGDHAEEILALYPHSTWKETALSWKHGIRDIVFGWPAWSWAKAQSEKQSGGVYLYYFDQHPPSAPDGAGHAAEIGFVFGTLKAPAAEDSRVSGLMGGYWVNFAKTGNPNGEGLPEWTAFSQKAPNLMTFNNVSKMTPVPNQDRLEAYDDYFTAMRKARALTVKE